MLNDLGHRLQRALQHRMTLASTKLSGLERLEWLRDPLAPVHRHEQRLDEIAARLRLVWSRRISEAHRRLTARNGAGLHPAAGLPSAATLAAHPRRLSARLGVAAADSAGRTAAGRGPARADSRVTRPRVERYRRDAANSNTTCSRPPATARGRPHYLDSLEARLEATSYRGTLARGFSITRRQRDQQVVTAADQVSPGEQSSPKPHSGRVRQQSRYRFF